MTRTSLTKFVGTAAVFAVGVAITTATYWAVRGSDAKGTAAPSGEVATQLVAVLSISSDCKASDKVELKGLWRAVRTVLGGSSSEAGFGFRGIGVSLDRASVSAIKDLQNIGDFEEYAVGGGWTNTAVLHYVVRDLAGLPAVPQLVIVQRRIPPGRVLTVTADSLIGRYVGVETIAQHVRQLSGRSTLVPPFRGE